MRVYNLIGSMVLMLSCVAVGNSNGIAESTPATTLPILRDVDGFDWWTAQKAVGEALSQPGADLASVVKIVIATPPVNGQTAAFAFDVFMRAGMREEAIDVLRELKRLSPDLRGQLVVTLYQDAQRYNAWDVAEAVVVVFAGNVTEEYHFDGLYNHFMDSGKTVDDVDQWLAAMPEGISHFWERERLRFNAMNGRGESLLATMTERIRANPGDVYGALDYLEALYYAGYWSSTNIPDLSWFPKTIKSDNALDLREVATKLARLRQWVVAKPYYEKALIAPMPPEGLNSNSSSNQIVFVPEMMRARFDVFTRERLAECLLELKQFDEAQVWMAEADAIRKKFRMGANAFLAGQVQMRSGEDVVQGVTKKEDPVSEDEPAYWMKKALYYRGLQDPSQERAALEKGLSLTAPREKPERLYKGYSDARSDLVRAYVDLLSRGVDTNAAVEFLRNEMTDAPAEAESAITAAKLLGMSFEKYVSADDEVLWNWLATRKVWNHVEERLLRRMFENELGAELEQHLVRAEDLAKGADISRSHQLADVEKLLGFPARSIALYRVVMAGTTNVRDQASIAISLFDAHMANSEWKQAESYLSGVTTSMSRNEIVERLTGLALTAARDGARDDAMRFWRRAANLNLGAIEAIPALAKAGLKDDLVALYEELQLTLPSSTIPGKVLEMLQRESPR